MAGIEVPGLYRKFRLLIDYGHAAGWAELGARFGVAGKTLKWYGNGGGGRGADLLPDKQLQALLRVIADAIEPGSSTENAKSVAFGPAVEFELALRRRSSGSIERLLATEARLGEVSLFLKRDGAPLVEVEEAAADPDIEVPLGTFFRLECSCAQDATAVVVIQNAQQIWGVVRCAVSMDRQRILAPGYNAGGILAVMRERAQPGLHRFVFMQTAKALPPSLRERMVAGVALDHSSLESLVDFYQAQPASQRRLDLLAVCMEPDD